MIRSGFLIFVCAMKISSSVNLHIRQEQMSIELTLLVNRTFKGLPWWIIACHDQHLLICSITPIRSHMKQVSYESI